MLICKFCGRECKSANSLRNHERLCRENPNRQQPTITHNRKGKIPWNKGLTKDTDERVMKNANSVSKTSKEQFRLGIRKTYIPNEEQRLATSIRQSLNNSGGRSKWFEVNGIKVQGTWERDIAIKFNELGIQWSKPKTNTDLFKYEMDGKIRSYAPDFYLPEYDIYLEIKGYWWGNDKEKMECVIKQHSDKKIIIIEGKEYLKILQGELVW